MSKSYQYEGPSPTEINPEWGDHTEDEIVCLLNGQRKKKIVEAYLRTLGSNREDYQYRFPGAPLISHNSRQKMAEKTPQRIAARRQTMAKLNNTDEFQISRQKGVAAYWSSEKSSSRRNELSEKAKRQHTNGLANHIREVYWLSVYPGSSEQERRKQAVIDQWERHTYSRKRYGTTGLFVMSTYEENFLEKAQELGIDLQRIKNGPFFHSDDLFYPSDFIIDDVAVVEVKSTFVENMQEKKKPGCLLAKREIVIAQGYCFLYIRDHDYEDLIQYINTSGQQAK